MKMNRTLWVIIVVLLAFGHWAWGHVPMGVMGHWDNGLMLVLTLMGLDPEGPVMNWKGWNHRILGLGGDDKYTTAAKTMVVALVVNSFTDMFSTFPEFLNQGVVTALVATAGVGGSCLAIAVFAVAIYRLGHHMGLYDTCDDMSDEDYDSFNGVSSGDVTTPWFPRKDGGHGVLYAQNDWYATPIEGSNGNTIGYVVCNDKGEWVTTMTKKEMIYIDFSKYK